MKLSKIIDCNRLLSALKSKRLPISVSLILSRNYKKLAPVMEDYEEKRKDLIEKYAKRDEEGKIITNDNGSVPIDNINGYVKEMDELGNTDIEVSFDTITTESFNRCEESQYDPLTMEEVGFIDEYMLGT